MSDVKKWYIGVYGGDAQARPCSPAEFEIIHASEGRYFVLAEDYDSAAQCFLTAAEGCVAAERRERALQQRLTAADERVDEPTALPQNGAETEPSTYKPGLYAVRHIDNWDGERDVVLTFAMLDAGGKWTDKENGEPLLKYTGDKVLRAWPLDCSNAPNTQIIGVPRNWLEDWALELVEAAQDGGQMSNQVEHLLEIHAKP